MRFSIIGAKILMNFQKISSDLHAVSRTAAVIILIVVVAAAFVGGIFIMGYHPSSNNAAVLSVGNGAWQFEENNQHVYNYTLAGTVASFNDTVKGMVIVPPTECDGLLLVDLTGSGTGGVTAINMTSGQTAWTATVPNAMMSQPITYGGLVIIGLGTGQFRNNTAPTVRGAGTNYVAALNFTNGQTVWTFPTLGEDIPTPVIYNGLVVFPNGNGVVYALNAMTGQQVWDLPLQYGAVVSMSSPALVGDLLYFGVNVVNGYQYNFDCVNLTDQQVSWSTLTAGTGGLDDCSPVVWNGVVISGYTVAVSPGVYEPTLIGLNATSGQILWQVPENTGPLPSGGEWFPPVTVWNGIVYSDSPENGTLFAVNALSGAQLWTFSTGKDTCNANIFDGNLWIVNSAGTLYVLNPTTGALLNSTNLGLGVVDGNVLFVNQNVIIWGNSQVISVPVSEIYSSS
jgi:outer membrane protein assembly factor BamB